MWRTFDVYEYKQQKASWSRVSLNACNLHVTATLKLEIIPFDTEAIWSEVIHQRHDNDNVSATAAQLSSVGVKDKQDTEMEGSQNSWDDLVMVCISV